MRIITLHCDYIRFRPIKKAIKNAEELHEKDKTEKLVKDALVVLTAVEKGDNDKTVKQLVESVKKTADEVKAKRIVLYPYAHLSSQLANPDTAREYIVEAEHTLSKEGFEVTRAPFGYYKELELKCKGHPLSELSKEFRNIILEKPEDEKYNSSHLLKEISRTKLDTSKLKENDHRILGQHLDLFSFNEAAPGQVFWHRNGLIIYNELVSFMRNLLQKQNYQEISTPFILDNRLWKISGHWEHYKGNLFLTSYEDKESAVKPMNCPGAMLVYKTRTRSYKDLPLRLAEFGIVHRKELSGVLSGLFRVVKITQDDAHIFCTAEQVESEIKNILELIKIVYSTFNFSYSIELSTRPEKFMGNKADWDNAEKALESALKKSKIKYKINKKAGAFYGPKIDIHIKDSLKREWQVATIQLDMQMPKRFELEYTEKDNKTYAPIVIHRAILGSLERFIGILLEHLSGNLPLWLSPIQARVISFTDRNIKTAEKILNKFKESGIRADSDFNSTIVNEKVFNASSLKIPYIITIGDKEEKANIIAVRTRDGKVKYNIKQDSFIKSVKEEIEKRQ